MSQTLQAVATHQPADKVVASGEAIIDVEDEATGEVPTGETIMSTTFKTSGPTDLMVHVTLECSILTELENEGGGDAGRSSFTEAQGRISVWLEFDGQEVAISQLSDNPQPHDPPEIGNDTDRVTFCLNDRKQSLQDAETSTAHPGDGHDTMYTYHRTKQANAFNWVILNTGGWGGTAAGHNIHTLEVKADFEAETPSNVNGVSNAEGFIGNRMVIVEPTKMSNHASV